MVNMLLPNPLKSWTLLCCFTICIALVHSAVLAQLARANQARVVARQTTQRQIALARTAANAAAARSRAQALMGPGSRLGMARNGATLGDSQRFTRGSADFFSEETIPIQDPITFSNVFEDGSNIENIGDTDFLLEERVGAMVDQAPTGFGADERVGAAILQEPGPNCGCTKRIVLLSDEEALSALNGDLNEVVIGQDGNQGTEVGMLPTHSKVGDQRTQLVHDLIHKQLHNNGQSGFQKGQNTPNNLHVVQNQHLADVSRSSSGEMQEPGLLQFPGGAPVQTVMTPEEEFEPSQFEKKAGSERTHHLIHKKLQNLHQSPNGAQVPSALPPINLHLVQNQHLGPRAFSGDAQEADNAEQFHQMQAEGDVGRNLQRFARNDQVMIRRDGQDDQVALQAASPVTKTDSQEQGMREFTSPKEAESENAEGDDEQSVTQSATSDSQNEDIVEPSSSRKAETELGEGDDEPVHGKNAQIVTSVAIGVTDPSITASIRSNSVTQNGLVVKSSSSREAVTENGENGDAEQSNEVPQSTPSTDVDSVKENEDIVGAPLDNLRERLEARLTARLGEDRHKHIHEVLHLPKPAVQNEHGIVAPKMSEEGESGNKEQSSNGYSPKTEEVTTTQSPLADQVTENATSSTSTETVTTSSPQVGMSNPNIDEDDTENDVLVGAETPNSQIDDSEEVGAFLHKNTFHQGALVTKPVAISGFGLKPTGVVVHNQHTIFGLRSSSGEEDENTVDDNKDQMVPKVDQNDVEIAEERTAHLIHKLHQKQHGSAGTLSQNIHSGTPLNIHNGAPVNTHGGAPLNIHVVQNQNAFLSRDASGQEARTDGNDVSSTNVDPETPSSARTFFHRHEHVHSSLLPAVNSFVTTIPTGISTLVPNVNVVQTQNAVLTPQVQTHQTFVPSNGALVVPHETIVSPSTPSLNHGSLDIVRPVTSQLFPTSSVIQSQSTVIGRNADGIQGMEDIDVPDLEIRKGIDEGNQMVGSFLRPNDPYYDNTNTYNNDADKTKITNMIEDNKRILSKIIDNIKSNHDKLLDSLKPKLKGNSLKGGYDKQQYTDVPQYQQYPAYAHHYSDQFPVPEIQEVSGESWEWEYGPSYRQSSDEGSNESADVQSLEILQNERSGNEDDRKNINADSLRFERSLDLDKMLKTEEEAVADLKRFVKRDEDLMMIDYVAEKMVNDIGKKHGLTRQKRQIVADEKEFQRLISDPNTKLDMTKTLENVGTVARSALGHQRAPLLHFRNAVGSVRDAVVATMKIPNQNFIIPAQYSIVNQQELPQLGARFGGDDGSCSDDPVTDTFQKVGSVVRSTIKSGQETIGHIGQAANHARTAFHTMHASTPRLRLAKIPATVNSPRISSRMGGDDTVEGPQDQQPKDFVNLGRLMDAVGLSDPDSTVGSESIQFVPRSRMAAMRNRFNIPEPPRRDQNNEDQVVGATMKGLRQAQQAMGAHSLTDLLRRMKDGIQGFVTHDILGVRDAVEQRVAEKNANNPPSTSSGLAFPKTEALTKHNRNEQTARKSSSPIRNDKDEIVGSGLPLAPELLHPFMNSATTDQEKKFLEIFHTKNRDRANEEHLGDVLGAINPVMFQRMFQEKVKINNTPHDVFHHHHDGRSHGEHQVMGPDVSTSMKIQGSFLKPFMGRPSKKNLEKFFSKYLKSSEDLSQDDNEIIETDEDESNIVNIAENELQDANILIKK
ncbi:unnamed protein product [Acanthoscelides obtectus]|uniref:Uncharacterized protein n=1 Tax=Acanthoscelides obtectus TaxID=200917 RepID=A0A9P0PRN7_ACAOB|nr:unnamed protein product [Acanthoscelides obtectus]CAK1663904.1 hypothetical protein AOBTE_LOCUS23922 [Acanthoscelides obtectus]